MQNIDECLGAEDEHQEVGGEALPARIAHDEARPRRQLEGRPLAAPARLRGSALVDAPVRRGVLVRVCAENGDEEEARVLQQRARIVKEQPGLLD